MRENTLSDRPPSRSMSDVIALPDERRKLVAWLIRNRDISQAEAAEFAGGDHEALGGLLRDLLKQGFLQQIEAEDGPRYRASIAPGHRRRFLLPSGTRSATHSRYRLIGTLRDVG